MNIAICVRLPSGTTSSKSRQCVLPNTDSEINLWYLIQRAYIQTGVN